MQGLRACIRIWHGGIFTGDEWCSVRAKGGETMENQEIRTALDRHWAASAAGDSEAEHEIYHDDVLVEYPQSGERIRGRHNIQALRAHHPAKYLTRRRERSRTPAQHARAARHTRRNTVRHRARPFGVSGLSSGASPDRLDALVWAVTELLARGTRGPRVRIL